METAVRGFLRKRSDRVPAETAVRQGLDGIRQQLPENERGTEDAERKGKML